MIKEDLLFKWGNSESHLGFKVTAFVVVGIIFTVLFGAINVKLNPLRSRNIEAASVVYFLDDELGRSWRLLAEEAGPFPGRLEIGEGMGFPSWVGAEELIGASVLGQYGVSLEDFKPDTLVETDVFAQKGKSFFPKRIEMLTIVDGASPESHIVKRTPILTPYDSEALPWMPDELPVFGIDIKEEFIASSWRFMLRLRPDGSVDQCFALSGNGESGTGAMCGWLSSVRFKSGQGDRWMGIRVEFINR